MASAKLPEDHMELSVVLDPGVYQRLVLSGEGEEDPA